MFPTLSCWIETNTLHIMDIENMVVNLSEMNLEQSSSNTHTHSNYNTKEKIKNSILKVQNWCGCKYYKGW